MSSSTSAGVLVVVVFVVLSIIIHIKLYNIFWDYIFYLILMRFIKKITIDTRNRNG